MEKLRKKSNLKIQQSTSNCKPQEVFLHDDKISHSLSPREKTMTFMRDKWNQNAKEEVGKKFQQILSLN